MISEAQPKAGDRGQLVAAYEEHAALLGRRQELREGAHPVRAELAGKQTSDELAKVAGFYLGLDMAAFDRRIAHDRVGVLRDLKKLAASVLSQVEHG